MGEDCWLAPCSAGLLGLRSAGLLGPRTTGLLGPRAAGLPAPCCAGLLVPPASGLLAARAAALLGPRAPELLALRAAELLGPRAEGLLSPRAAGAAEAPGRRRVRVAGSFTAPLAPRPSLGQRGPALWLGVLVGLEARADATPPRDDTPRGDSAPPAAGCSFGDRLELDAAAAVAEPATGTAPAAERVEAGTRELVPLAGKRPEREGFPARVLPGAARVDGSAFREPGSCARGWLRASAFAAERRAGEALGAALVDFPPSGPSPRRMRS
jgi:hypothetical protein